MIEKSKINEIVKRIVTKFELQMIILFGSHSIGIASSDSDIDLLIVKDTNLPRHKRNIEIRRALIGLKVPLDLLVYTKFEFEQEKKREVFIYKQNY